MSRAALGSQALIWRASASRILGEKTLLFDCSRGSLAASLAVRETERGHQTTQAGAASPHGLPLSGAGHHLWPGWPDRPLSWPGGHSAATAARCARPAAGSLRPAVLQWQCVVAPPQRFRSTIAAAGAQGGGLEDAPNSRKKQTLEGKVVDANTLFTQEYLLSVPYAQRPYLWGVEQSEQLLEDLLCMACADRSVQIADLKAFALGAITLAETEAGSGATYTRKHVFDGQQRIVTLCLLLAALHERLQAAAAQEEGLEDKYRRHLQDLAESLRSKVHQKGDVANDRPDLPRITLRQPKDTDFLTQLLTDTEFLKRPDIRPDGATQTRLLNNIQMYRTRLRELPASHCDRLARFVVQKTTFIVTVSSDFGLALNIFRSSMAKGVDMRPIDLLKALVFEAVPVADQERWGTEWERLEAELSPTAADGKPAGDDLLSELCAHLTPVVLGRFGVTNSEFDDLSEMYAAATTQLGPAGSAGPPFIERVLQPFAQAFRELRSAHVERGSAPQLVSYHLRSLGRFLEAGKTYTAELRPAALLLLVLHAEQRLPDDRLLTALEQLEALALASTLCKWSKKARRERCLAVLRDLGWAGAAPQPQRQRQHSTVELPEALQLSVEEREATVEALDGPVYAGKNAGISKPLLLRLNEFLLQRSRRDYVRYEEASAVLTVEHVLPQKPAAGSSWWDAFTPEQHEAWVGRIANLALLAGEKISGAGNKEFSRKKAAYRSKHMIGSCNIPLTDGILSCEVWTPAVLEKRQCELIDLASACWRLH